MASDVFSMERDTMVHPIKGEMLNGLEYSYIAYLLCFGEEAIPSLYPATIRIVWLGCRALGGATTSFPGRENVLGTRLAERARGMGSTTTPPDSL